MASLDVIADPHPTAPNGADSETTSGPPAAESGGILTVDLGALVAYWRALSRRAMPAECAGVV